MQYILWFDWSDWSVRHGEGTHNCKAHVLEGSKVWCRTMVVSLYQLELFAHQAPDKKHEALWAALDALLEKAEYKCTSSSVAFEGMSWHVQPLSSQTSVWREGIESGGAFTAANSTRLIYCAKNEEKNKLKTRLLWMMNPAQHIFTNECLFHSYSSTGSIRCEPPLIEGSWYDSCSCKYNLVNNWLKCR